MTPDPASQDGRMLSMMLYVLIAAVVVPGLVFAAAYRFIGG